MTDRMTTAAALLCCILSGLVGLVIGAAHPRQTLVPAYDGTPQDLPAWACREVIELRVQNSQLLSEYRKLAAGGRPVAIIHYRIGRGEKLCP